MTAIPGIAGMLPTIPAAWRGTRATACIQADAGGTAVPRARSTALHWEQEVTLVYF
jgi:hypothetical protein